MIATFFNGVDFLVHGPFKHLVNSIIVTKLDTYTLTDHLINKSKTGGQLDTSYQLDWNEFRNCIITTSNYGYKKIPTKVYKNLNVSELNIDTF